jgi:hypothetical protein
MPSTLPLSNWFSAPCSRREGVTSPSETLLLNELGKVVSSAGRVSHSFINKCFENASCIARSRLLISACSLSLCAFPLQAKVANPITETNGDASEATLPANPTPSRDVQQSRVLKAMAAAAEAHRVVAAIEELRKSKSELTNHQADATATNKFVQSTKPKFDSLAQ